MEATQEATKSRQEQAADEARARLGPKIEQAQARLMETNERVQAFIKENPGTCLLGAAAVGFIIGKWASRR